MSNAMTELRTLYDRHGASLLGYLRRLTGRADLADDLLQDTFVQAIRSFDRLRDAGSARAWLFSIARHVGLNALRNDKKNVPISENLTDDRDRRSDPRIEPMRRAIAELPEAQRETLALRLGSELTYEEIAEVLNIPVGTVRSRLHHAVKTLRERMERGDAYNG